MAGAGDVAGQGAGAAAAPMVPVVTGLSLGVRAHSNASERFGWPGLRPGPEARQDRIGSLEGGPESRRVR